jgi:ribulose-5-phosphate 4-epimerase/fuculose-1-phosphate aldolase
VRAGRFLINPYGWHWSEITASSLVLCDAAGRVLEGDNTVEPTAFYIHSHIHLAAPQAVCVLHTHMPYATALTLRQNGRLEMCEQNALIFYGRLAYDDEYGGLALDGSEGDRIAAGLGNASALMLASHGVIVTGRSVAQAFTDLYYLERAAQAQVLAASGGHALRLIPEDVQRRAAQQHMHEYDGLSERLFGAYRRMLDKEEPDYRC